MTPRELYALRSEKTNPDTPGWKIRVVPNKFPALSPNLKAEPFTEGLHRAIPGFGAHEIIIETPVKNRQLSDMSGAELVQVLGVMRERLRVYFSDGRFRTVVLFKNHGKEAGASLVHSHTQLVALPVVPSNLATMVKSFTDHREKAGNCLYCEILVREEALRLSSGQAGGPSTKLRAGSRIIESNDTFVVLAPFAAASPYQVRIVPRTHSHDFSAISDEDLEDFALVLGSILRRLQTVLGEHPYNMVLHTAPTEDPEEKRDIKAYHWFLEISPKLTNLAGFEMGSGFFINTVAPEECAELLRRSQESGARSQEPGER
jgi:UDPglucose--hexose-1-phosphate uridylyltransferase